MSKSHFIHISIDMDHFHCGRSFSNFIKFPMGMCSQQPRLTFPHRLFIHQLITRFTSAVCIQAQPSSQCKDNKGNKFHNYCEQKKLNSDNNYQQSEQQTNSAHQDTRTHLPWVACLQELSQPFLDSIELVMGEIHLVIKFINLVLLS